MYAPICFNHFSLDHHLKSNGHVLFYIYLKTSLYINDALNELDRGDWASHLGTTLHGGLLMVFEKIKPCRFSLVIKDGSTFT
jgi:hypothetical protein